jgi:1-aminocyclopropane-1-carboxylate deaminase/D-cysteine desulfhydrase-like pyridoxal-dependent ACC family enzyme
MNTAHDFLTMEWIQKVNFSLPANIGLQVDMLRLDLIHPMISGNKWLKLHYWLEKFRAGNYNGILTPGGPWSNHLHACGYACHKENIPMKALVKGYAGMDNAMLGDLQLWGCKVEFVNRKQFFDTTYAEQIAKKENYLLIPMGGEGPEGEAGVISWFNQLPHSYYDYIFCSVGTGTTLSGIAKSNISCKNLIGMNPGTGDKSAEESVSQLNEDITGKMVTVEKGGDKMGKLTLEILAFMQEWLAQTGIPLDFVYTAPMCKTFVKMAASGQLLPESRVLLVHTGGLQGNRSFANTPG